MTKGKGRHPVEKLTALKVKRETKKGFYADGNGLYLKVDASGAKRWIQRLVINGKRRDMGLGSANLVSLSEAREIARKNRALARSGGDPLAEKRKLQIKIPTFKEASFSVHELNKPTWKNAKHAQQWINTLEKYAFPFFGDVKMDKIQSSDVLLALSAIWTQKPETARRVQQRIGKVMKWSIGQGWRIDDPSRVAKDSLPNIDYEEITVNHKSLPYDLVAGAIEKIQNTNALDVTKLAFEFLILTAGRSGDVRGARWEEINGDLWEIPKERMKMKRAHRVPLSNRCLEILKIAKQYKDGSGLVFSNNGKPLSDSALSKLMKENLIQAVPHGFRASFKTWASEKTNTPDQVSEFCLAHVPSKLLKAYNRTDQLEKRRILMDSWAQYVGKQKADVISLVSNTKN